MYVGVCAHAECNCFRQRNTGFLSFQFQALAPGQIENVCFLRDMLADSRLTLPPLQVIGAFRLGVTSLLGNLCAGA
jgi:hypothetical protein